jgi:cell division protein FtsW
MFHLAGMAAAAVPTVLLMFMQGYQMDRITAWLNPWNDVSGLGFHSIQGFYALALGGVFGAGLGESRLAGGLFLPNAFNDFIFAIVGEEFGLLGAGLVIVLFLAIGYLGVRTSLGAPDTFGAMLAAGITAWICLQAFINIGVVVGLIPVTGIPLPFVSAGGSSLIISFAAIGILLSISRETVEKGTWNDAPADRGRGDGRSHLPGSRRRPIAPRPIRRA